jgi:hypothetical protein
MRFARVYRLRYSLSSLGLEADLGGLDVELRFTLDIRCADGQVDDVLLRFALG